MALTQLAKDYVNSAITDPTASAEIIGVLNSTSVLSGTEAGYLDGVTAGTVTASKALVVDSNKDIATLRNLTMTGTLTQGAAGEIAAIKGMYNSGTISVTVPSITDPDIARVQVDVSSLTFAPAVGDAVIAVPKEALPTNCRLQGAWVYQTDGIEIVFGSEGGNVTGAAKNFQFLIFDLT